MANPIIKIKRGGNAPTTTLQAGEFAVDQVNLNLYLGVDDGTGTITNKIVGGEGTFATKAHVTSVTGTLGTMSQQNDNSVAITGGSIEGTTIGASSASSGAFTSLTASAAPVSSTDVVRKSDLDSAVSALGSVFHFVGNVSSATTPFDLSSLADTSTGAYYKVDVAGAYIDGATTLNAKVGDAFVKASASWQKLDNVDAVVSGTANEISVAGDEDAGYTVSIDSIFSGRVTTVETNTQNITASAGETDVAGILTSQELWVGPNSSDAVKILNPAAGPASIEAPNGASAKDLVIKAANGSNTIKLNVGGTVNINGDTTITGDLDVSGSLYNVTIDGGVY